MICTDFPRGRSDFTDHRCLKFKYLRNSFIDVLFFIINNFKTIGIHVYIISSMCSLSFFVVVKLLFHIVVFVVAMVISSVVFVHIHQLEIGSALFIMRSVFHRFSLVKGCVAKLVIFINMILLLK